MMLNSAEVGCNQLTAKVLGMSSQPTLKPILLFYVCLHCFISACVRDSSLLADLHSSEY